jgi:hypothetical protein
MSGRKQIAKAKKVKAKLYRQGKTRILFNTGTRIRKSKKRERET